MSYKFARCYENKILTENLNIPLSSYPDPHKNIFTYSYTPSVVCYYGPRYMYLLTCIILTSPMGNSYLVLPFLLAVIHYVFLR